MVNEKVENVMSIAFELARIREKHGAQSDVYLSEVRALRAEAERLAAQAARDDAALYQTIGERDNYHKWADKLADGIATHLGIDIGEHTAGAGANNPWANALEAIQAVAQSAPLAQQAREYPPLPEGVKARFKCEDCDGTGYTGEMIPGSEFQPPDQGSGR